MQNFEYQNKTKFIFGHQAEEAVGKEVQACLKAGGRDSRPVLLHHSGGHVQKSGLVDKIKKNLTDAGLKWVELTGVQANPRVSLVRKGIELCRKENAGLILAIGGGSAMDSAKGIAVGAFYDGDVWDFYARKLPAVQALPVGAVVTIPASGSEDSTSSVVTNEELNWKQGLSAECIRPAFAILNPELTYSLPPYQTACGVVDILAHIMERYFTREPHVEVTDGMAEGVMRAVIRNAGTIFSGENHYAGANDYGARAEIMLAGALAHNNIYGLGRVQDWASHHMEHELSAFYDIAHGAGLAIIFPAWMMYNIKLDWGKRDEKGNPLNARFARFAEQIFGVDGAYYDADQVALEGMNRLKEFYRSIGMPVSFKDAGLPTDKIPDMARGMVRFGPDGGYRPLDAPQIEAIYHIAAQ
jgi:alcohol dehydrogenase YqhD (iron-dependent ADH family)